MAGRTSWLNLGKRNGCDQSMSSDRGDDGERCDGLEAVLRLKFEIELIAAFLSAWIEVVRLEVKPGLGFGVVALLLLFGDRISPSSGSSSSVKGGTSG